MEDRRPDGVLPWVLDDDRRTARAMRLLVLGAVVAVLVVAGLVVVVIHSPAIGTALAAAVAGTAALGRRRRPGTVRRAVRKR